MKRTHYQEELEKQLTESMPNLIVRSWVINDGDWYNLVVTVTSFDPNDPTKLDPKNPVNECFISEADLGVSGCFENLTAEQIIKWMNQPLRGVNQ